MANKMKSYTVGASVHMWIGGHVEVKAKNKEEAKKKAINVMMTDRNYYVTDFDGTRLDFDGDQIEIVTVEEDE